MTVGLGRFDESYFMKEDMRAMNKQRVQLMTLDILFSHITQNISLKGKENGVSLED